MRHDARAAVQGKRDLDQKRVVQLEKLVSVEDIAKCSFPFVFVPKFKSV
jgi:hypothetical protein